MIRATFVLLLLLFATGGLASAGTANYLFTVHTDSTWAPGYIDLEFNPANLTSPSGLAVVYSFAESGFTFGSGVFSTAGVSGSLIAPPLTIPNDQGDVNYFTQEVTAWGSLFSFFVNLSGPAVGETGLSGSDFYVFLFDSDFQPIVSPLDSGAVAQISLLPDGSITAQGSQFEGGDASVESIPEPGTAMAGLGLLALAALRIRRRKH